MKKHSTLLIISIMVVLTLILTWIFPITYLNGELVAGERMQAGLLDLLNYPVFTFFNFVYIFVYVLSIGGLYGLLNKSGVYRVLLDKVVKIIKGKEFWFLLGVVILGSAMVSFTGITYEALIFVPFIIGIVLLLGYDMITGLLTTIGPIAAGIIGTTFSSNVAGTFNGILSTEYTDLIIAKIVLLVLSIGILVFNIVRHAKKIEKNKNVESNFFVPEKVKGSYKIWPLATLFIAFTVLVIVSTLNWSDAFNVLFFDELLEKILAYQVLSKYIILGVSLFVVLYNILTSLYQKKKKHNDKLMSKCRKIVTIVFGGIGFLALLKIFFEDITSITGFMSQIISTIKLDTVIEGFTFDKLLGSINSFGNWTYSEYIIMMIIMMIIIKFVYRVKLSDALDNINSGFKDILYTAIVIIFSYTVLILASNHPVILTILKPLLNLTDGLSILWYPLCTFISALFNTDFTYYSYGVLTLNYATSYFTSTEVYPLCGLITQAMYGFALLIAPTSTVLLFGLSMGEVKYTTWLKNIWPMLLELLIVIFISFIIVLQFFV